MPQTSSCAVSHLRASQRGALELTLLSCYLVSGMGPLSPRISSSFIHSVSHSTRPCGALPFPRPHTVSEGRRHTAATHLSFSAQSQSPRSFLLRGAGGRERWTELDPLNTNRAFPLWGDFHATSGVLTVSPWLESRDRYLTPSGSMAWGDVDV